MSVFFVFVLPKPLVAVMVFGVGKPETFELLLDVLVDVYFREAWCVIGVFKTPKTVYSKSFTRGAFLDGKETLHILKKNI